MALDILIVDDELDIRNLVAGILGDEGYEARTAACSDSALAELARRRPSLVVLDIWLQGSKLDGLELLDLIKERDPQLPVIIISGHGNVETAVAAIKRGAYDFIEKPFQADQLLVLVQRATEAERLKRENEELRERAGLDLDLTGESVSINGLRGLLKKVARTNSRVLITGPAGSGKEVSARLLHDWSGRRNGPFVVVNAANMAPERLETELFGIEEHGALVRVGLLEKAHGGTLFLDEVGDMPLDTQAKILRVLTEQSFERVGGTTKVKVDVRVLSSSARDLRAAIADGGFREDLYHRLDVMSVAVPPLADRREDIPLLVDFFIRKFAPGRAARLKARLSEEVMATLQAYHWPGNVRQLRNIVERLIILASEDDSPITADALPDELSAEPVRLMTIEQNMAIMAAPLREAREAFEREYLRVQITRFSGNISRTASFVGMERSALHRKLKSLGLHLGGRGRHAEE
ncbi:MAG: sigma-54 dependent transcriptional regulator [Sphingomonadales bacterium]